MVAEGRSDPGTIKVRPGGGRRFPAEDSTASTWSHRHAPVTQNGW